MVHAMFSLAMYEEEILAGIADRSGMSKDTFTFGGAC